MPFVFPVSLFIISRYLPQVVISIVITLFGLRVLSGLRPYLREDENSLAEASLWITFLTLFVGLLIKSDVAEEDG